ncbi:hypothetical protein [Longitalea luteola]|uniref:hypothetical protein n=1 Tax=Longitalea luteola TaxID=2812563 RepID=UPI001A9780DA|nr:hypothetical protein [Longitalea luteola]
MPAIAAATGISKENLYKWEKGTKPSDVELYNKLNDYLDKMERGFNHIMEDAKLNGSKKSNPNPRSLLTGIFIAEDEEALALTDELGVPGNIITLNDKPVLIARRNDSSIIGSVDGLIQVNGDSIDPRYTSGAWIAVKKLRFTKILNGGFYYYVIDKNLQGILGKVRPSVENNSITLFADNEHNEITRNMDDILAIFSIEAVITK